MWRESHYNRIYPIKAKQARRWWFLAKMPNIHNIMIGLPYVEYIDEFGSGKYYLVIFAFDWQNTTKSIISNLCNSFQGLPLLAPKILNKYLIRLSQNEFSRIQINHRMYGIKTRRSSQTNNSIIKTVPLIKCMLFMFIGWNKYFWFMLKFPKWSYLLFQSYFGYNCIICILVYMYPIPTSDYNICIQILAYLEYGFCKSIVYW